MSHQSLHRCGTNFCPCEHTVSLGKGAVIMGGIHPPGLSAKLSVTTKSGQKHNLTLTFIGGKTTPTPAPRGRSTIQICLHTAYSDIYSIFKIIAAEVKTFDLNFKSRVCIIQNSPLFDHMTVMYVRFMIRGQTAGAWGLNHFPQL